MNTKEQWKDVVGFEGLYQVSNLGRVRSLDRIVSHKRYGQQSLTGKPMCPSYCTGGRLQVKFRRAGRSYMKLVHRLVLEAFVGPCPSGCEGCHYDGNPANNIVSNLRWDTTKNNCLDKRRHGRNGGRRVRRSDGVEFTSVREGAESVSRHHKGVLDVCKGRQLKCGYYGWEYIDD